MHRSRSERRGFTLIELLITTSIMALLIGILLPSLAAARRSARDTFCKSNLRQQATALFSVATGNRAQLPANRTPVATNQHITWRGYLAKNDILPGKYDSIAELVGAYGMAGGQGATTNTGDADQAWQCPVNPYTPLREVRDGPNECVADVASQYAYNGEIAWNPYPLDNVTNAQLVSVARPSTTLMLLETRAWWPDLRINSIKGRGSYQSDEAPDNGGYFSFWHGSRGMGNYAMHDGSVSALALLDTLSPKSMWHETEQQEGAYDHVKGWLADAYR